MAQYYAPNFSGLLPLFDGQSAAGGKLYAYRAGTSIPAPLFNDDGVELGSWVSIDSNGCADFLLDSSLSYKLVAKDSLGATVGEWDNVKATNAPGGMDNPMENVGDLIVGGTGGSATALPIGTEGQVLKVVSGAPAWGTDTAGMSNPMTTEGDLIVGTTDGEPARLGVGTAGQVLTSNGTTWAPASIPTQTGDHKTAVDGSDTSPDYLAAKLAAGAGISLTNTGSAVSIAADTQPGDHNVVVTNADASAGTLADKLVPGTNVTLTPLTDGDGVQTLEISATGGGGGGGSDWREVLPATNRTYQASSQASGLVRRFYPFGPTVRSVMVMTANYKVGATCKGHIRIYKMQIPSGSTESAEGTATMTSIAHKEFTLTVKSGIIWVSFDADVDVSDPSYQYFYAIGFNNAANPNPSDYLKFQLSAAVSTSGTGSHTVEFHITTNKLIDSTTPNTLGYTVADYTYVSGISSKVES